MRTNFTLRGDIIDHHSERMDYLKKYLPFFQLQQVSLVQFREGKYAAVDMSYITMALLRYMIEENHFNERFLTYQEISDFIIQLLTNDFDLMVTEEEGREAADYIFDKIKNDGKPFTMDYFDPAVKKIKTARMKLVEARIQKNTVVYVITSDAIEFYLETKEVKDESKISIQQLLLEKMIAAKNFKGGTDVVRRINSEVAKLRQRKQEVLALLGLNVFEGVKALEEFQKTGMRWFEEEQKAFVRNKDLIEQALKKAEAMAKEYGSNQDYVHTLDDIYELEMQLQKAMNHHSQLLSDCMELQVKSDEIIRKYKFSRLRNAFDFNRYVENAKQANDLTSLQYILTPLCLPYIRKSFYLGNIDELLTYTSEKEEIKEQVKEEKEEVYRFDDELEEERISENYYAMMKILLQMLYIRERFTLEDLNRELSKTFFDDIFKNSDYYSFLVHLCQKREYKLSDVIRHQDTFFDAILARFLKEEQHLRYRKLDFKLELLSAITEEPESDAAMTSAIEHTITTLEKEYQFETSNIVFVRVSQ